MGSGGERRAVREGDLTKPNRNEKRKLTNDERIQEIDEQMKSISSITTKHRTHS